MRYLFTIHPAFGHFHSVVPLAEALTDAGHEVAFATGRTFGPVVERVGFRHFACGLDFDGSADLFEALPASSYRAGRRPVDAFEQLRSFVEDLAPRMADDLPGIIESWRPDVILRDPVEFGGYIAAERYGLPHATPIWATYISAKALCPDAVTELRRRYALPADPALDSLDGYLVLDFLPAEWTNPRLPYPLVAHRFCAPPFDLSSGSAETPAWLSTLPRRPTVYATLGTTFNRSSDCFRAVLAALAAEPVNLIMTVGRSMDPRQFGPQPPHIRIEQYIPHTLLLPHCDALVFHGGYNSLQSALWHGLPMVVLPQGAGDNLPTGWRCAELGAGILIEENPPQPDAIRSAVRAVIEQPSYRVAAERLRAAIMALPVLDQAVRRLEILGRDRAPQLRDCCPQDARSLMTS
jgi:UDP:flavonoid glycosyltransferase YjiC (YdhE family)